MRASTLAVGLLLLSTAARADDHSINFDKHVDFSAFKTFAVRDTKITSGSPELNNPLFGKQVAEAARVALKSKGLVETSDHPDLFVDCTVTGLDYVLGAVGVPRPQPIGTPVGNVAFTDGTLVIDLTGRAQSALVWRGVYHRPKSTAAKLAEYLPSTPQRLIAEYPPRS